MRKRKRTKRIFLFLIAVIPVEQLVYDQGIEQDKTGDQQVHFFKTKSAPPLRGCFQTFLII
jgi:hypothetical protein